MIAAALIGILAGIAAGLLGVGGGILFVPALVIFMGQTQLEASATSLLAIIPVAVVGAWRQSRYGNVELKAAALLALFSPLGAVAGVLVANAVPDRALAIGFAILLAFTSYRMAKSALAPAGAPGGGG